MPHEFIILTNIGQSYLRVQLATIAFEKGHYSESADRLTANIVGITDLMLRKTLFEPRLKIFSVVGH